MPRKIKRRRGPEITDRGAKDLRGRLGLHEQAASQSGADYHKRKARELTGDVFPQPRPGSAKRRVPDGVWQDGAYLDEGSVGAAKLTFNPAVAGHTHGWGDVPNGMSWGKVDQQDFFRVLDRRYRRLR